MSTYLGHIQDLSLMSASRRFATEADVLNSQPNYEHEVAIALDTRITYQGIAPIIGGWAYATGEPLPSTPPAPGPVNDQFTKLMLEFVGKEGSITHQDFNAAGWPRKWTTHGYAGFGAETNVGEKFYPAALRLDGNTVITAPDDNRFVFGYEDFTVRGYFLCDFPLGTRRTLVCKGDQINKYMFFVDRLATGEIIVREDTVIDPLGTLLDRNAIGIVDRGGAQILTRFPVYVDYASHNLQSVTQYSDTLRPGWHEFKYTRTGTTIQLAIDKVQEDQEFVGDEYGWGYPGPLTIGGYGPPINGVYHGNPWIGGLDRFAIDIGIAR